jgi:SAM-dependent methyltransferase
MDTITPDPIMRIASGFMASKFLFAASEFGFFDALEDSPADLAALAARTGLTTRSARILADGCVALGLLEKQVDTYANSAEAAAFLTRGGLAPGMRFWDQISYLSWASFAQTLAHGPQQSAVELPPALQQVMLAGIEAITAGPTAALVASVDVREHRRLLDLGCGNGSWSTALLRANPNLSATLVDLPVAIGATRAHVSESGLADRVTIQGADVLTDALPHGHDLVMVNNLLHYFDPDTNNSLLAKVARVSEPGTRLLLADFWTDAAHISPVAAALMAGEFAAHVPDGDVYSIDEISAWLASAGWQFQAHHPLAGPMSLVSATRV